MKMEMDIDGKGCKQQEVCTHMWKKSHGDVNNI